MISDSLRLYQKDIRALQLAISAIRSGIEVLLLKSRLTALVIDEIYLAGTFGNHIDVDTALKVGMIPNVTKDKIHQVGNIAGEGACKLAVEDEIITSVIQLKDKISTVSLESDGDFKDNFIRYIDF